MPPSSRPISRPATPWQALYVPENAAEKWSGKGVKPELDGHRGNSASRSAAADDLLAGARVQSTSCVGAVREFLSGPRHHADLPLGVIGAHGRAATDGWHAERLSKPVWSCDRARDQEWDPDRRIAQSAARERQRQVRSSGGSRGLRLRPILMTTPRDGFRRPAARHGRSVRGAESRQPIGWVIVGGVLAGTIPDSIHHPDVLHAAGR